MTASRIVDSSGQGWMVSGAAASELGSSAAHVGAGAALLEGRQALSRVFGAEDLGTQRRDQVESRLEALVVHLPCDREGVPDAERRSTRDHGGELGRPGLELVDRNDLLDQPEPMCL